MICCWISNLRKKCSELSNQKLDKILRYIIYIVTGNAFISSEKIVQKCNIDLISAYLPGNSDLHNSSRSNVTLTYQCHITNMR